MQSVRMRRYWKNRTEEQKKEFSKKCSAAKKETYKNNPKLRKKRAEVLKKTSLNYWKTVSEEKRKEHIKKMSIGMKKAWKNPDPSFGSRVANKNNLLRLNGNLEVIDDLPRVNTYSGVITESDLEQLND